MKFRNGEKKSQPEDAEDADTHNADNHRKKAVADSPYYVTHGIHNSAKGIS